MRRLIPLVIAVSVACTSNMSPESGTGSQTPPTSSPAASSSGTTPAAATTVKLVPAQYQLPAPVQRAVAVRDGNQVLIAGGLAADGTSTGGVYSFSPSSGRISQIGSMPQVFHDAAGAMIGKDLLVFGGGSTDSSDAVQAFDPTTGKSSVRGHLPMALSDLTGATIGRTVYLVGGWNGTTPQPTVWSTTDGTHFTKVATLPAGVRYPAVAAVGSDLVVAGGELASGSETTAVSLVDTTSGKVTKLAKLREPIAHAMAFTDGGTVFVAGGRDDVGTALNAVIAIDPSTGHITAAPKMPLALSDAAVATSADGQAILVGGAGLAATRTVLETKSIATTSIGTTGVQMLKDPPISTPFAKNLPASAAQRPFAGKLLIADRGNNRLLVLDPSGHVTWTYPSPSLPQPTLPFYFPDDAFWVHGGHAILVNEEENDVLAEIAYPSGKTLWTYGHPRVGSAASGYLQQPDDLYPYPGGGMVVADAKNCRILFFSATGKASGQVGQSGNCTPGLPNTVGYPNGGTPLPNGDLLISEINGAHVSRLGKNRKVIWSTGVPGLHTPSDPQPMTDGSTLVVDYNRPGAVIRFSSAGRVLWTYRPTSGSSMLDHPSLGAPLPNGLIAVNDDYNHRVVLIDPVTNSIVFQYGHTGVAGTGPGYLNTPDGLDLLLPGGVVPLHVDFASPKTHPGRP
jgi:hypothetical protein